MAKQKLTPEQLTEIVKKNLEGFYLVVNVDTGDINTGTYPNRTPKLYTKGGASGQSGKKQWGATYVTVPVTVVPRIEEVVLP